jgi:hypothetical protein
MRRRPERQSSIKSEMKARKKHQHAAIEVKDKINDDDDNDDDDDDDYDEVKVSFMGANCHRTMPAACVEVLGLIDH